MRLQLTLKLTGLIYIRQHGLRTSALLEEQDVLRSCFDPYGHELSQTLQWFLPCVFGECYRCDCVVPKVEQDVPL